jgi:putative oxidoreductase
MQAKRGKHSKGDTMAEATQRLYVPALGGIYSALSEYMEPILRIALGAILIPHGLQKLFGLLGGGGIAGTAQFFDKAGYAPATFWVIVVGCTELIGGTLLVVGLFTRFAALAITIFMINAVIYTSKTGGFFWTKGGSEFSILLLVVALFFLVRGGGHCSLDRTIGREI